MSYRSTVKMAVSTSLRERIIAAAAEQGEVDPEQWMRENIWPVVSSPGWANDWAYAEDNYTDQFNPDTGARPDVIGDDDILAAVQARRNALAQPPQAAPAQAAAPAQEQPPVTVEPPPQQEQ